VATFAAGVGGQVADAATGRPIGGAVVSLHQDAGTFDRTTFTTEDGRFVFAGVPAGTFRLQAKKAGYFDGAFGQSRMGGRDRALVVAEGVQIADASLRLWPPAAITGTIRDEANQPVQRTDVVLLRRLPDDWDRNWTRDLKVPAVRTTAQGEYRFPGLEPAEYVVAVPGSPGGSGREAYPTAYFPNVTDLANAEPVTVGLGEMRDRVDFQLQVAPAVNVSGRLVGPDAAIAHVDVNLYGTDGPSRAARFEVSWDQTAEDGSFRLRHVPPGTYVIEAEVSGPPPADHPRFWGRWPIDVTDHDITDVSMPMEQTYQLSGRAVFESATPLSPEERARLSVTLEPMTTLLVPQDEHPDHSLAVNVDRSGAFAIGSIRPGRYLVTAGHLPGGWYLKSAIISGQDAADWPIEIGPGVSPLDLVVTLSNRSATVRGVVQTPERAPVTDAWVLLFSTESQLWNRLQRRARSIPIGRGGAFSFDGLPPGDYYLACLPGVDDGTPDPRLFESVMASTMRVRVSEGETQDLSLRIR
jgi:hypothetical protein